MSIATLRPHADRPDVRRAARRAVPGASPARSGPNPSPGRGRSACCTCTFWVAISAARAIIILPILLAIFRPGTVLTRQRHRRVADALLGTADPSDRRPIETHFHVFGSLAFWPSISMAGHDHRHGHRRRPIIPPRILLARVGLWGGQCRVVALLGTPGLGRFEDVFLIWSCVLGSRGDRGLLGAAGRGRVPLGQEQLKSAALEWPSRRMQATA